MSLEDARLKALEDTANFISSSENWTAPPEYLKPNSSIDREATTGILGLFNKGQIYE